jgi:hypothetical protein
MAATTSAGTDLALLPFFAIRFRFTGPVLRGFFREVEDVRAGFLVLPGFSVLFFFSTLRAYHEVTQNNTFYMPYRVFVNKI